MKKLLMGLAAFFAVGFSVAANAEPALPAEIEAGCPAVLPTFKPQANANFTVLDRSALAKECLAKLREQNGDDKAKDDEDK